jgi:hypothetical protein
LTVVAPAGVLINGAMGSPFKIQGTRRDGRVTTRDDSAALIERRPWRSRDVPIRAEPGAMMGGQAALHIVEITDVGA